MASGHNRASHQFGDESRPQSTWFYNFSSNSAWACWESWSIAFPPISSVKWLLYVITTLSISWIQDMFVLVKSIVCNALKSLGYIVEDFSSFMLLEWHVPWLNFEINSTFITVLLHPFISVGFSYKHEFSLIFPYFVATLKFIEYKPQFFFSYKIALTI